MEMKYLPSFVMDMTTNITGATSRLSHLRVMANGSNMQAQLTADHPYIVIFDAETIAGART